jgi:hypothetical protein
VRAGTGKAPDLKGTKLGKRDLAWLDRSWIPADLAQRAGLRRLDRATAADILGQKPSVDCAGIGFPYIWPGAAEVREWRVRRDNPEIEITAEGKKKERRKYLTPPGRGSMLYFSPDVEAVWLEETGLPVVVVEGEKKTLALQRLAMHGRTEEQEPRFVAAGISGVWNWRRTTKEPAAHGGSRDVKEPIADLQRLAWEGRTVYICFDADVRTNKEVHRARWALAKELARDRKAAVRYLEIPAGGEKGVDDLLAAQGPEAVLELFDRAPHADLVHDIRCLIEAAKREDDSAFLLRQENVALLAQLTELQRLEVRQQMLAAFPKVFSKTEFDRVVKEERRRRDLEQQREEMHPPEYRGVEYVENEWGIWRFRMLDGAYKPARLTNFMARIECSIRRDDGETRETALRLLVQQRDFQERFTITTTEFAAMHWPMDRFTHHAIVSPGAEPAARAAIQNLSRQSAPKIVRTHTGWSMQEGQPIYMHAGGAIVRDGLAADIEVDFDGKTKLFRLPDPNQNGQVREAIQASLRMLDLAPARITFPLYAAVWRVPMGPVNTSMFLSGQTQVGKTQLAALAQQHFGAEMTAENLPASWIDTANSLESKLYTLKDALCVIDDFNPQGPDGDVQRMHALADRVIRSQGNKTGRGRMTSDIRQRMPRWPRGMIVSTGEETPRGHSLRARMVILDISPGDVRFGSALTAAQTAAVQGAYALAMAAYVQWLAPQMAEMEDRLRNELIALRQAEAMLADSRRAPDNLAKLTIGLASFLRFAVEKEAISQTRAEALKDQWRRVMKEVLMDQDRQQAGNEPCRMFIEMLRGAMASGKAHVADTDGCEPRQAKRWGWREDAGGEKLVLRPMGDCIGWVDHDEVYLEPQASYAVAKKMAREMGEGIPIASKTLHKRLKDRNMLTGWNEQQQEITVRRMIVGTRRRVLAIWANLLSPSGEPGQSVHPGQGHQMNLSNADNPSRNPSTNCAMESFTYVSLDGLPGESGHQRGRGAEADSMAGFWTDPEENPSTNPATNSLEEEEIAL